MLTHKPIYFYCNGMLVSSTTEHQTPDLQTKTSIYPDLSTSNNIIQELAINTENCVDYYPQRQLDTGFE